MNENLNLLIDHFGASPHPTPNPHPTIDSIPIPLIARLHIYKNSKFIAIRINFVSQLRICKLSQDFWRPCSPAVRLDNDMCRRAIMSLKNIVCLQFCGSICYNELAILSTRLVHVSKCCVESRKDIPRRFLIPRTQTICHQ